MSYACGLDPAQKLKALHNSAKERDKEFSLSEQNLITLFRKNNGTCDYTGKKFNNDVNDDMCPSVDRISPFRGYIAGNIILCTRRANNLKERYFESKSLVHINIDDMAECYDIYSKLLDPVRLSMLSLNGVTHIPNVKTRTLINRFFEKVLYSISIGIDVPSELRDLANGVTNVEVNEGTESTDDIILPVSKQQAPDYALCKKYIEFCDKHVTSLSLNEFSTKVSQSICDFSLNAITERELFVIDSSKEVTADNLLVVDSQYIKVLNAMKESSINFDQFKNYLNNICKVIYKE